MWAATIRISWGWSWSHLAVVWYDSAEWEGHMQQKEESQSSRGDNQEHGPFLKTPPKNLTSAF